MSADFKRNLKIVTNEQDEEKKRKIDAYRCFVSESMPGYIRFVETLNQVITKLEQTGIIGKTKMKTRVKALNSSIYNTEQKELDDIFGFEFITENERDKEILMLIIHNLMVAKYIRQKNHNKSNGYFAHHCTGGVKKHLDGTEIPGLEKHILEAQTNELKEQYRDLSQKEQKKHERSEVFERKPRYPVLREELLKNKKIDKDLQEGYEWALKFIDQNLGQDLASYRRNIPILEIQFKTKAVEHEIKYGNAQHIKYKKTNPDEIKDKYLQRKLIRGVDFPFVFIRNEEGNIQLEDAEETLINMWPFIEEFIAELKRNTTSQLANYDLFFAKVFPDLEKYVQEKKERELSIPAEGYDKTMAWTFLKNKIVSNNLVLPYWDELKKEVNR